MRVEEFIKRMQETEDIHRNHNDFYELAEKYGFSTPWCDGSEDTGFLVLLEIE